MKQTLLLLAILIAVSTTIYAQDVIEGADYRALRYDVIMKEKDNPFEGAKKVILDDSCYLRIRLKWEDKAASDFVDKCEKSGEDLKGWAAKAGDWAYRYGTNNLLFVFYSEALLFGSIDIEKEEDRDVFLEFLVRSLDQLDDFPKYDAVFKGDLIHQIMLRHGWKGAERFVVAQTNAQNTDVIFALLTAADAEGKKTILQHIGDAAKMEVEPIGLADHKIENTRRTLRLRFSILTDVLLKAAAAGDKEMIPVLLAVVDERITGYKDFEYVLHEEFTAELLKQMADLSAEELGEDTIALREDIQTKKKDHIPDIRNTYEAEIDPLAEDKAAEAAAE